MDSLIEAALNAAALRSKMCERHPEREAPFTLDLPSIGVKQFLCQECKEKIDVAIRGIVSNDISPGEWDMRHGKPEKDAIYAYRDGRTREGKPTGEITWRKP